MYRPYFKFNEEPFGVTADPRFLYLGAQHREALASLAYGTECNRGFLALIAKPGMGKTSILNRYLESLRGKARTAFVFRTDCNPPEFIRHILLDLGIDPGGKDLPAMHEALNQVLVGEMQAGRRVVLVIDEAQNLEEKVLESVRLLSNFETPSMKLMQIVLAGQPELAEKLSRPSMTQLLQRISLVVRIAPLNSEEINAYIDHRLFVAGRADPELFTVGARKLIAEHSEGVPRKINNVCFNALSLACALKRKTVERATVLEVLADLDLDSLMEKPPATIEVRKKNPSEIASAPKRFMKIKKLLFHVPKFVAAGALVLAVVTNINKGEALTARTVGTTEYAAPQRVSASAHVLTKTTVIAPLPSTVPLSVRVTQGQTLYRISVENLGRYDSQTIKEIRSLNPFLSDPDYIRVGQQILVPSAQISLSEGQNAVPENAFPSLREVGKE
jgi:type II secretory pathway predicted ATPase ExeA/LysM repeat protein